MKFYDRERELRLLQEFANKKNRAHIVVVTGRRRIGKTRLVREAFGDKAIYLFAKKKSLNELLKEWSETIRERFPFFGEFTSLEDLLNYLFVRAKEEGLVLIVDEIQNLYYSSPESFSDIQKVFDLKKYDSQLLMVFTGSLYSLMEKIFKNSKEPLFGRASEIMNLSYLPVRALEEILKDHDLFSGENLLHLFSIFDGIPFYVEEFLDTGKKNFKASLRELIVEREFLWEEGENLLKEEMGKESSKYFSILSAIASGRRTRNEISQYTGIKELGGYLNNLEKVFKLIERKIPIFRKNDSKLGRYYIRDNFLDFWFRFLDRYSRYRELGQKEKAFEIIWKELPTYEGRKLEDLIFRKIIEENPLKINFTHAGGYWDRKGSVEVDLILIDEENRIAYPFEIKRSRKKITGRQIDFLRNLPMYIPRLQDYKIQPVLAWIEREGVKMEYVTC